MPLTPPLSSNRTRPKAVIIVPCFNEAEVLQASIARLASVLDDLIKSSKIHPQSHVLYVDDGSTDDTWNIISTASESQAAVCGLKLSRNFGHQNALFAGLMHVAGTVDCAVTIDADLQQNEQAIAEFVSLFRGGYDIVTGVREDRSADAFPKRAAAGLFYAVMRWFGVPLSGGQADFRLLSATALSSLAEFNEVHLFLRGIIPSLGFKTAFVKHSVSQRKAGKTKYSWRRMASFALHGITSFSIMPIRLIAMCGIILFVFSVAMSCYVLLTYFRVNTVPGWASTVLPIYFIGGIQLLSIAVIGEYVGKSYMEIKRRPRYIIEKIIPPRA